MRIWAPRARTQPMPHDLGDPELERFLALLQDADRHMLTIAALRRRGIENPAQSVYELQVAGYTIDRVHISDRDGGTSPGYWLRSLPA